MGMANHQALTSRRMFFASPSCTVTQNKQDSKSCSRMRRIFTIFQDRICQQYLNHHILVLALLFSLCSVHPTTHPAPLPSPPLLLLLSATDAAFDRVDIAWFSMDPSRVLPLPAIAPYSEIQRFHDGLGSSFSMAASASSASSSSSSASSSSSSSSANDIVSDADLVAAINGSFWSRQAIAADGAYLAKVVAAYRRAAAVCGVRVEALLRGDDAGTGFRVEDYHIIARTIAP
jgi:hypothetical protein